MKILFRTVDMVTPNPKGRGEKFIKARLYAGYVTGAGRVLAWSRDRSRAIELEDEMLDKAVAFTQMLIDRGDLEGEIGSDIAGLIPAEAA